MEAVEDLFRGPRRDRACGGSTLAPFGEPQSRRPRGAPGVATGPQLDRTPALRLHLARRGTRASRPGRPADRRAGRSDPRRAATPAARQPALTRHSTRPFSSGPCAGRGQRRLARSRRCASAPRAIPASGRPTRAGCRSSKVVPAGSASGSRSGRTAVTRSSAQARLPAGVDGLDRAIDLVDDAIAFEPRVGDARALAAGPLDPPRRRRPAPAVISRRFRHHRSISAGGAIQTPRSSRSPARRPQQLGVDVARARLDAGSRGAR